MKKKQLICLFCILLVGMVNFSCSKDDGPSAPNDLYADFSTLFSLTDYLVGKIPYSGSASYESKNSPDGNYRAYVLGRLVVVQKKAITGPAYETIKNALLSHYSSNSKVKDVFVNRSGDVTIDCRN